MLIREQQSAARKGSTHIFLKWKDKEKREKKFEISELEALDIFFSEWVPERVAIGPAGSRMLDVLCVYSVLCDAHSRSSFH